MKKILLTILLLSTALVWGQETDTIFYDSFENYEDWTYTHIGDWTLTDLDLENQMGIVGVSFPDNIGHPFAAKIVNSSTAIPVVEEINIPGVRNYEPRTGEKVMGMFAALAPPNNDWNISPQITLGDQGNRLSFYVKSAYQDNNKYEKFEVLISTTDTNPESFTAFPPVYEGDYFTEIEWTEISIDLDDYSNQNVYLAIHYISEIYDNPSFPPHLQKRANALLMDDFTVTKGEIMSVDDELSQNTTQIYPNPFSREVHLTSSETINKISVFDQSGKLVYEQKLATKNKSINLSHLPSGVYVVQIHTQKGTQVSKVIKK